ncbi:MAG: DUF192 domain-containing protein [Myxococcales bacterium]|nr:DUF192 domain-containing protein [Myxococcales bacterium]
MIRLQLPAIALLSVGCTSPAAVALVDESGTVPLEVFVTFARSENERREGLRALPPLGMDEGLLLEFPVTGEVCIDNGGVPYAIDVIFLGDDRHVMDIARNLEANASDPSCVEGTRSVLEVRGGVASAASPGAELHLVHD